MDILLEAGAGLFAKPHKMYLYQTPNNVHEFISRVQASMDTLNSRHAHLRKDFSKIKASHPQLSRTTIKGKSVKLESLDSQVLTEEFANHIPAKSQNPQIASVHNALQKLAQLDSQPDSPTYEQLIPIARQLVNSLYQLVDQGFGLESPEKCQTDYHWASSCSAH